MIEEEGYKNFRALFCCDKLAELVWSAQFEFLPTRKQFIRDSKNVTVCPYCKADLKHWWKDDEK